MSKTVGSVIIRRGIHDDGQIYRATVTPLRRAEQ